MPPQETQPATEAAGGAGADVQRQVFTMLALVLSSQEPNPPQEPQVERVLMYSGEFLQC